MRALVVGGTRFVGLRLVAELARRGWGITVLNRGQTPARLPGGVERLVCDRRDHPALRAALAGQEFDVVFDIIAYTAADVGGLLEALGGRTGRLVMVSTGSVYRAQAAYPWDEDCPLVEDDSAGAYGWNKRCAEDVLWAAHARGLPVSVVRPGYIYGPHNNVYREALFFDRLVRGLPILVPGDGNYLVQFGHVDDLARLLLLCAQHPAASGRAFNFAGARAVTANTYVEFLFAASGHRTRAVHFDPQALGLSPADVARVWPYRYGAHTCRDIGRARYLLGYQEEVDLQSGLASTFAWWQSSGTQRAEVDSGLDGLVPG
jgi:nucleoside-diphosphate-sugar epimerase